MASVIQHAEDFQSAFKGNPEFYYENSIALTEATSATGKVKSSVLFKDSPPGQVQFTTHLRGSGKAVAICPIDYDNNCHFGVIDIDAYNIQFNGIISAIYSNNLPLLPFRSKSGGLHLYMFLKKASSAKQLVKVLEMYIEALGLRHTFGEKKVEIFPKQTTINAGDKGNAITLPYYGGSCPISFLLSPSMTMVDLETALSTIRKKKTTMSGAEEALDGIELSDAPPCVQRIITTSALGEDSGRNNFMFTVAVYLKKKIGTEFFTALQEMNERLQVPLEQGELKSLFDSVSTKEYNYKCKDVPCSVYCDKRECAKREFGFGKEKGYFSGLDYGKLVRLMSEDPYYQWELKKADDEKYRTITFVDEAALMDQRIFGKLCLRYLNHVPVRMKDNEWFNVLNQALLNVEERQIERGTDTSEKAVLKEMFLKYLTRKQSGMNRPVQVKLRFSYFDQAAEKYYFKHEGFEAFLAAERIKIGNVNMREFLLSVGAKDDVLKYLQPGGKATEIMCWSKLQDPELKEIEGFYDDVFSADEEMIKIAKLSADESDDSAFADESF